LKWSFGELLEETWMYPSPAFSNIALSSFNVRVYLVVFVCVDRIPLQLGFGGILWER
jgi:hypothetical protein